MKLNGSTYTVDAQVDSSQASAFKLQTDRKVIAVHGATGKEISPEMYEITVQPAETSRPTHTYHAVEIVVDFGSSR
ncbi:MAG: hypothetical protein WBF45_04425 [Acidobacteriaceae bacterium]